ncbi:MAG: ribosome small subunit-dependent GTPase A [Burkholderiales bacterium]
MRHRAPPKQNSPLISGLVVATFGRSFAVELTDSEIISCTTRGRRGSLACGDRVAVMRTSSDQGVIEATDPRSTLFYRSDAFRQKLLAANVTQVVVVVAPWPVFSGDLLDRCLIAAEHAGARSVIVLNKSDLPEATAARQRLALYPALGYEVVPISAKYDVATLAPCLAGHTSLLIGESGMGKSTIVNRLLPEARAATAEVSRYLEAGKHTTSHARLYHLGPESHIVDAPGLQAFGLRHLDRRDLAHAFVEFRPLLGQCRFADCRHLKEPDCAVVRAADGGGIAEQRLKVYRRLLEEVDGS